MPKFVCECNYVIDFSPIPCPDQWKLFPAPEYAGLPPLVNTFEFDLDALRSALCPSCERFWIFWLGFGPPAAEYLPAQRKAPSDDSLPAVSPALKTPGVWVFCDDERRAPAAVFTQLSLALDWVAAQKSSGTLTRYPLDTGVYDWSVSAGLLEPVQDAQRTSEFIATYQSPHLDHLHFEDGQTAPEYTCVLPQPVSSYRLTRTPV